MVIGNASNTRASTFIEPLYPLSTEKKRAGRADDGEGCEGYEYCSVRPRSGIFSFVKKIDH